ncbi:MAG: hypothetical protein LBS00_06845, partial [Synergistaceae bacterium]|nr:hypothetical protein [Synergistaceae bacterium]
MRKGMRFSVIVALSAAILTTACSVFSFAEGAAAATRIAFGRQDDVVQLDPVMMNYTNDIWTGALILEGLVRTTDDGTHIEPALVSEWEISDDGLIYTFKLLPGL